MTAIFKREFRSYMNNVIGYVFLALVLLAAGALVIYQNVVLASTHFEAAMEMMQFVLIVAIPVLTMRSIAEEKRSRVDRLIYSLPLRSSEVVAGKYLAMLSVFTLACVILAFYPIVLRAFGLTSMANAYLSLVGFWLLGSTLLSVCLFLSSLTESQVVAALLGVGGALLFWAIGLVPEVLSLGGVMGDVLGAIGIFHRFSQMCGGMLRIDTILMDASLIAFFLFLTVQMMERKRRR